MTMHTETETLGQCTFSPPADQETGVSNQGSTDCGGDIGCSVQGQPGGYGTSFNNQGGGVYAMEVGTSTNIVTFTNLTSGQVS